MQTNLRLAVQWVETNEGPLRVACLGDMPEVDFDWLLTLNNTFQEVVVDFEQNSIQLINLKPVAEQEQPLTIDGLAALLRERAKVLLEHDRAV